MPTPAQDDQSRNAASFAPTARFSDRAQDYVKFRPTYPAAAIDAVLDGFDPSVLPVADVGAGTGISARLLADRGCVVSAIEPNAAMRDAAEPHRGVRWIDGTAEATTLAAESVAIVLCAQAFHWFGADAAVREFVRVLRSPSPPELGGRIALLWNIRDESDPFTRGYSDIIRAFASDATVDKDLQTDSLARAHTEGLLGPTTHRVFESINQRFTLEAMMGRVTSSSYAPKAGPAFDQMRHKLMDLHARHSDSSGEVVMRYQTHLYTAQRA